MQQRRKRRHYRNAFKKPLFICGLLVFTLFLTGGCKSKQPIKIGFAGCLTGRLSDLGLAGRNAVMLAVEEVNQAGGIHGRTVELLVRDDKHDPAVARQIDTELIDEGVVAIIGHMTSTMTLAVIPLINERRMLLFSPTTSTNELTGIDDYFVRLMPPNISEIEHLAGYLFRKAGIRSVACVYDLSNQAFTESWVRDFTAQFKALGGTVMLTATFTSGEDVSYLRLAHTILYSKPDSVLIVAGALDTAMICQQLRKLTSDLLIVSSGWSGMRDVIQHGGHAVEGVLTSQAYDHENQQAEFVKFKDRYEQRFGRSAGFAEVFSYDTARVLFQALARQTNGQHLKDAIINHTFPGLQGDLTFDRYGENTRPRFLMMVKDGQFVIIE